jgi:NTP pyrophosphatase (non-canonical NTP hydrolase)
MRSFSEVELEIIRWGEKRQIIPNSTTRAQLLKMISEIGELADAETKGDMVEIKDALGDVVICMIMYCALYDIDLLKCINIAYDQIKDRRGTLLPNGVFVKD